MSTASWSVHGYSPHSTMSGSERASGLRWQVVHWLVGWLFFHMVEKHRCIASLPCALGLI